MLRLTTFGGVGIRDEDRRAETNTEPTVPRRVLALLVLLAAAPEPGMSRDTLAAYLWSESDEEHARNALRQALHTLRRELRQRDLVVGGVMLKVNPALLISDVREFDDARAVGDLERALGWYHGPFLAGFHIEAAPEFERWVEDRRSEYGRLVASALEQLAGKADRQGRPDVSAEWWRRLAALDPLNSRVAMNLMGSLAAGGNPAGALKHAQAHEALVREELGVSPDAAFASLVARIRSGQTMPAVPSTPGHPAATPGVPKTAPNPVVERARDRLERELAGRYAFEGAPETAGNGTVRLIRARDLRHDRPVMLKVLHPALASQLDAERFLREIKLTARLQHPHVLPLLDSGEIGGRPWFTTPRPEGETLRTRLSRDRALDPVEAVRLARELADALTHAHGQGVLHRDVSPENVLLAGGHALLTNLGVARAFDAAAGTRLTDTGMLLGSPAYMSPEQAAGERELDGRSDIYSLAAVLFEMLTGEPLFSGPTPQAIMAKRANRASALEGRLADIPPVVTPVLIKALAIKPAARFVSAEAFAAALDVSAGPTQVSSGRWRRWFGIR